MCEKENTEQPEMNINIDRSLIQTEEQMLARWGEYDKPLISIYCATYNHEKYIRDALDGFLIQQTDFPFEILLHDDASTDGTADIVREYEKNYPHIIKPIYQTVNQYSQGNRPISFTFPQSKGEYIALCEGDDYWIDALKLQKQIEFLNKNNEFVMYSHQVNIIDNTENCRIYSPYYPYPNTVNTFEDILFNHFIPTLSLVFRKKCLPEKCLDFFKKIRSGDIAIELIVSSQGLCYYDKTIMGCYRHHDGGITKSNISTEDFKKFNYELYENIAKHLDGRYDQLIKKRLAWVDYNIGRRYLTDKKYLLSWRFFYRAVTKDFFIFPRVLRRKSYILIRRIFS